MNVALYILIKLDNLDHRLTVFGLDFGMRSFIPNKEGCHWSGSS